MQTLLDSRNATRYSLPKRERSTYHESWVALENDKFIMQNMFLFFDFAGMHGDGFLLLSDPRCLLRQMKLSKCKQVEDEIVMIMSDFQNETNREITGVKLSFLIILRDILVETERYVMRSKFPGMMFTQLFCRIWNYKKTSLIGNVLRDVERFVLSELLPSEWLKSGGLLPAPELASRKVLTCLCNVGWLRENSE